jgi:hypothetical protein
MPDAADFTDLSPAELLGGQSGVEGDGCVDPALSTREVALDDALPALGYSPADVLAFTSDTRSASVRWATVDPPGASAVVAGTMQVELTYVGPARATLSSCGSHLELPVRFHVRSENGVLELEGTSTLGATRQGAWLQAQFPLLGTGEWAAAVRPVLDLGDTGAQFELALAFSPTGMSGDFYIRGAGLCSLARWPAQSCQVGVDDPEHGAGVRELLQHLQQAPSWNVPELHCRRQHERAERRSR